MEMKLVFYLMHSFPFQVKCFAVNNSSNNKQFIAFCKGLHFVGIQLCICQYPTKIWIINVLLAQFSECQDSLIMPQLDHSSCVSGQTNVRLPGPGLEKIRMCNKPFPSYLVPLFQNEAFCKTFHMKMSLICMKMNL